MFYACAGNPTKSRLCSGNGNATKYSPRKDPVESRSSFIRSTLHRGFSESCTFIELRQGTLTVESYKYLGLSTVVLRQEADGVNLSYIGTSTGDAGDKYTGLDRFGRVVKQYWVGGGGTVNTATLDDGFAYTYDADGNVTSETNGMDSAFSENFTYDGLSRLTTVSQGTNSSYQWSIVQVVKWLSG